jgi:KDO2-lipid IV(A) lauroyltransferase
VSVNPLRWPLQILGKLVYCFFYLAGAVVLALPFVVKKLFARVVAFLWFYVFIFRTKIILHNLAAVFPRQREESMADFKARCEALCRANLEHVVLCFLEIYERFHWSNDVVARKVRIVGLENGQPYLDAGKGFFVTSAHLGNWELITVVGVYLRTRLAVVTKFLRNSFFDDIWVESRKRFGLELLQERGSGHAIVKAIRKGRVVGFIMDQHTGEPHGIESSFLGLPAWSPKALGILAPRLKAPVLPAYLIRQSNGTFVMTIEADLFDKFRNESPGEETEALRYHVRLCNENMERWIRKHPEQYLWLHRRFKNVLNYRAPLPWDL